MGRHLLVYNHTGLIPGKWGGRRSPLNVAVSDDGKRWQAALVFGERARRVLLSGGHPSRRWSRYHVTYTWKRQSIKHVVLDPKQLVLQPMLGGEWPR